MAKAKFIELNKDQTKAQLKEVLTLAGRNPRYSGKTYYEEIVGKNHTEYKPVQRPGFYVD